MHEALLYEQKENNKVRCTACKHYCNIAPGHTGICGVRLNKNGKLYLLVYGKPCAVHVDPIEKKPLFHFLPGSPVYSIGTVGCNFSCSFCQNWDISQVTKEIKKELIQKKQLERIEHEIDKLSHELPPEDIVEQCARQGIPSIAYTYNEPAIFFEYVYDTAKLAKKQGLKNVMVSSGYESETALKKLKPYVDGINIDLKAFSEDFYKQQCKARLAPVLDTIKLAHKLGIWIEITTLIIPTKNDSDEELTQIAEFISGIDKDIPWHVTAFHPSHKMTHLPRTGHEALIRAYDIGKKAGLNYVYVGNIIDEEHSTTYCPKCKKQLIERSWHHTTKKNLEGGSCKACGTKIAGVWK